MSQTTEASGGGRVIEGVRQAGAGWAAELAVPQDHPFFFDHPLDHVSGMQTLCGLLELADAAAGGAGRADRLVLDVRFPAMGALSEPTGLSLRPGAEGGSWVLSAGQAETEICTGALHLVTGIPRSGGGPAAGGGEALCPGDLVHRFDRDNVVLGVPESSDEAITAPVAPPRRGHYLASGETAFTAASLIESGRQFATVLEHWAAGWTYDTKMLWTTLHADLPAVPSGTGYSFRWPRKAVKGSKLAMSFELLDAAGTIAGRLEYVSISVSPAAYERFRSARNRGAAGAAA